MHPALVTAYRLLPAVITLFSLCLFASPLPLPYLQGVAPQLALIGVFYWGIYRESIFPYWFVFLYGLLHDSLLGIPIGTSSFIYLAAYIAVVVQRGFLIGGSFVRNWGFFALLMIAAALAYWALGAAFFNNQLKLAGFVVQAVLTICLYPCFYGLYSYIFHLLTHSAPLIRHAK
jgi:rod shape-determining protein MreD